MSSFFVCAAFCLLVVLLGTAAASSPGHAEIAVLLRDRVGRDADLDPRPLTRREIAALEAAAGVPLTAVRLQPGGAQVLSVPGAPNGPAVRAWLAGLRAAENVVYADRVIETAAEPAPRGAMLDRVIVKLRDPGSRDRSDAARPMPQETVRLLSRVARVPLFYERPVSGGAYALRLFQRMPDASVAGVAARLAADPRVAYAEPAVRGRFGGLPDDPLFDDQWALQAGPAGIDAPGAWRWTHGSAGVTVAMLDSGVRAEHPDLRGRLEPGYDFVSDTRRSGDFDGRDADPSDPGDATLSGECAIGAPPTASTWHGTHVAGIVGAAANDGTGVAGVDWRARILPVRVGAKCGIDPIDLIDAIRWASGAVGPGARIAGVTAAPVAPARVLNLSMEFPGPCPRSLQDAISDARAAGALVVVAAGNAGRAAGGFHPANCQGVLAVHATDAAGGRASYSNYGDVDLSAPGGSTAMDLRGGVLSTVVGGRKEPGAAGWAFKAGTSMAAPMVAGVASLVLSVAPGLTGGELRNLLEATARSFPVGTGADCTDSGPRSCGAGIVDAGAAVAAARRLD